MVYFTFQIKLLLTDFFCGTSAFCMFPNQTGAMETIK